VWIAWRRVEEAPSPDPISAVRAAEFEGFQAEELAVGIERNETSTIASLP
jgi:hypothetical protein